jgi:sodium/potassium-transporting ATPase subunit alpha
VARVQVVLVLATQCVPFSSLALKFGDYPAALTDDLLYEAQSVYFFTLVVMQWGCVILSLFSTFPDLQYS